MKNIYKTLKLVAYRDEGGILERAEITDGYIVKSEKKIGFTINSAEPMPARVLSCLKADIKEKYRAEIVEITVAAPVEEEPAPQTIEINAQSFSEYCRAQNPLCNGFFNDVEIGIGDSEVTVSLCHGGKAILEGNGIDRLAADWLSKNLGRRVICKFVQKEIKPREHAPAHAAPVVSKAAPKPAAKQSVTVSSGGVIYGKPFSKEPVAISSIEQGDMGIAIEGDMFGFESQPLRNGKKTIVSFAVTDGKSSIRVKEFMENSLVPDIKSTIEKAGRVAVLGDIRYDEYARENVLFAKAIALRSKAERVDDAPEKRIELHLHTNMSAMDALTPASKYIETAVKWGWDTVAITDHGVVQAFPEAYTSAKKYGFKGKILYGVEAYFVNDSVPLMFGASRDSFDDDIICFDIETTGLSHNAERITEIGAVRVRGGKIVESFNTFVDPERPIPAKIVELTGITDAMVKGAPKEAEAVRAFIEFAGKSVLVAHNASFDMSFIRSACERNNIDYEPPYIDTLALTRLVYPKLKNHKLDTIAEALKVGEFNHHRACDDADVLGRILIKILEKIKTEYKMEGFDNFNAEIVTKCGGISPKQLPTHHMIIFVKNKAAMRNLFIMISDSHIKNYYKRPRITKSMLMQYRKDMLIGSACEAGELYRAIIDGASASEVKKIASFYDFLEIQPIANNHFLVESGKVRDDEALRDINRRIVALGKEVGKPVVATGDVHFLNPEDELFRSVLLGSQGFSDSDKPMPLYLRTTQDMLDEFAYLGAETAREVVITNSRKIADQCEIFSPLPPEGVLFKPTIENSEQELENGCIERAKAIYGDPLPEWIDTRLKKELVPIIENGYSVTYIIAKRLVKHSNENGYLVGSRGSVGSSFVAHMAEITEVNGLEPHYVCPNCKNHERMGGKGFECGVDMPDKVCPVCGTMYVKDGFDIPFETFLGFGADKVPDIDLNFSGEYQTQMHRYVEDLLGKDKIFKAGTITAIQDKMAIGYVKKYAEEKGKILPDVEIKRLALGITGVRKSTGQHPGGMMVVPTDMEIYDFSPVQYPANDEDKGTTTTHFDYHSIHDNILKLDMLGHDDPTVIKFLEDSTGTDARKIPLDDKETMSLFLNSDALKYTRPNKYSEIGTFAVPEFGTEFVRGMLRDTKPTTFGELVRISGLSHGTDVWLGNAADLVRNKTATLKECICTRDDIMLYLIAKGMDKKLSFTIMESVRKGKGLKPEWEEAMQAANVPAWYINSCKKIKYMFPKAHAAAYVTSAFRIAWYKVHYPLHFYAAYFTVRADDFNAEKMIYGEEAVERRIDELMAGEGRGTAKDKTEQTILEVCYEMYLRGYSFLNIDINKSDAKNFIVVDDKHILPPFNAIAGLGESVGQSIVEARAEAQFDSIEDLRSRTRLSQSTVELMQRLGILNDLPESSQTSFF